MSATSLMAEAIRSAADPETGKQRWVYDPMVEIAGDYGDGLINRGVSAWLDPDRMTDRIELRSPHATKRHGDGRACVGGAEHGPEEDAGILLQPEYNRRCREVLEVIRH